jgi:hypothetical protein
MLGFQEYTLDDLVKIRRDVEMINTLVDHGLDVDKDGAIVSSLMVKAKEVSKGGVIDYKSLVKKTGGENVIPLKEEQVEGWITFTNIALVLSVIMVLSALTVLFWPLLFVFGINCACGSMAHSSLVFLWLIGYLFKELWRKFSIDCNPSNIRNDWGLLSVSVFVF